MRGYLRLPPSPDKQAFSSLRPVLVKIRDTFLDALTPVASSARRWSYPKRLTSRNDRLWKEEGAEIGDVNIKVIHQLWGESREFPTLVLKVRVRPITREGKGVVARNRETFDRLVAWWAAPESGRWIAYPKSQGATQEHVHPAWASWIEFNARLLQVGGTDVGSVDGGHLAISIDDLHELADQLGPFVGACLAARREFARRVAQDLADIDVQGPDPSSQQVIIERALVVRHLLGALSQRPLVLLSGISGSGKTQLASRIGAAWAWIGRVPREQDAGSDARASRVHVLMERLSGEGGVLYEHDGAWLRVAEFRRLAQASGDPGPEAPGEEAEEGIEDASEPDVGKEMAPEREVELDDDGDEVVPEWPSLLPRFALVPVRPDWQEAASLWGYADHRGTVFHGTDALRVVLDAWTTWRRTGREVSHVLVLDEMNLSRLEHYGSDLLSAMERLGEPVIHLHAEGADLPLTSADGTLVPARIGWAPGLKVIGTVNVDETTFTFAPKVLDRAAVLEFLDIDLERAFAAWGRDAEWKRLGEWFEAVQRATEPHTLHLGYRAAEEIANVVKAHLGDEASAWDGEKLRELLDLQLRNKVLPRVRGPRGTAEPVLLDLMALAVAGTDPDRRQEARGQLRTWIERDEAPKLDGAISGAAYPEAARKARRMLDRLLGVGFTGYF